MTPPWTRPTSGLPTNLIMAPALPGGGFATGPGPISSNLSGVSGIAVAGIAIAGSS